MKVSADVRQGKRNVRTIDERDRVHDERNWNDAHPPKRNPRGNDCCAGLSRLCDHLQDSESPRCLSFATHLRQHVSSGD